MVSALTSGSSSLGLSHGRGQYIMFASWARHPSLMSPLSTQVYNGIFTMFQAFKLPCV